MAQATIHIDPKLWESFSQTAAKKRKIPQNLLAEILREYLEGEENLKWWRSVLREYRGRELSDAEAVDLVRKHRRASQLSQNGRKAPRPSNARRIASQ